MKICTNDEGFPCGSCDVCLNSNDNGDDDHPSNKRRVKWSKKRKKKLSPYKRRNRSERYNDWDY